MGFMFGILAVSLLSIGVGFMAGLIFRSPERPIGTLRIDRSEEDEEPHIFLELYHDTSDIGSRKTVTLNVSTENYIAHK